jgi:hypothetical protein
MTPQQIAADIDRGIQIKAEIALLVVELKAIEERLEAAGLQGGQVPLQNPNLEGKQFLAKSSRTIVPVRFESDLIIGSFEAESPIHDQVKAICGDKIVRFFKASTKLDRVPKDGEAFRKLARELLDSDAFAKLIHAVTARDKKGIAKSKTVIAWDDAKPVDQVASA